MKRILAVSGNSYQQGHLRLLARMLRRLAENGFTLVIHRHFYDYLAAAGVVFPADTVAVDDVPPEAEAVVSVGGDGTFLHTAGWVGSLGLPIVGINTGHLGYLAHFSTDDIDTLAESLRKHSFRCEQRAVLSVKADSDGRVCHALNEIAILKDDTSSMIVVHTTVDEYFLAEYRADGLLVATATGSTGYNMSAGGPLLQPCLDAMVVTPVAPHSLTLRPLVISGSSRVRAVTTTRAGQYRVSVDGESFLLPSGTGISIERAPFDVKVLIPTDHSFADTLRHKLGWATGLI